VKTKEVSKTRAFLREASLRLLILAFLFVAALGLRLYHIGEPLFDFSPVRQYHSALLARGFYEWLLNGDVKTIPPDGIIEPPLMELAASLTYYTFGGEHLWFPRLLSALFWMLGGVFVYLIARKMFSPNAAVFSVFFYLFIPAAVLPSRAFMPEPLMIMLLLASVFTILRYHEVSSMRRLVIASAVSSLALFVKPGICLFQIFGVFIALMVYRRGILKSLTSAHLLLFAVLSLLPMGLYYLFGAFIDGFIQGQVQSKVVPAYILETYFWKGWLDQIASMVGYIAFAGALLGALLVRAGSPRALMAGLWGGYFLFGLVFTYHIHTHGYYSLQFIPVVALSLASVWDSVAIQLRQVDSRYYRCTAALGLLLVAVSLSMFEHRTTILGISQQGQGANTFPGTYMGSALIADYEGRVKTYEEIGEIVDHSPRTIFSAPDFGYPLLYHGRLGGKYWPNPDMMAWWRSRERTALEVGSATSRRELFDSLYSEISPSYFIVIRSEGWKDDRVLRRLLTTHFPVVARHADYLVFDLRNGDYRPKSG
jgi:4-amino-4-deoxy-L-arabinose transferase-like glycosyltransferase